MSAEEFDSLMPCELDAYLDQHRLREKRTDERIATVLVQLSNCILAGAGIKQRFKHEDFLGSAKPKQQTPEQMMAIARIALAAHEKPTPKNPPIR